MCVVGCINWCDWDGKEKDFVVVLRGLRWDERLVYQGLCEGRFREMVYVGGRLWVGDDVGVVG